MDRPATDDSHESFGRQLLDFGQSLLHSAIENPINGLVQVIDHAANVHIPELDIIGAPTHNSWGTKIGAAVGTAIDVAAISIASGGLADVLVGTAAAGGVVTSAVTGLVFESLLQPTDNNSAHFVQDRLENGLIGAITFGTMGTAAKALNASGVFAMSEVRSLGQSIAFGAITGEAGGLASVEAHALIKDHKILPSTSDLAETLPQAAIFGGALGAAGYVLNQATGPASRPTTVKCDLGSVTTVNGADGQPISFKSDTPTHDVYGKEVRFEGTKSTNGEWDANYKVIDVLSNNAEIYKSNYESPLTVTKAVDGSVSIIDAQGVTQIFNSNGFFDSNYWGSKLKLRAQH